MMNTLKMFLMGMVIGFMAVAWVNTTVTNSIENLKIYEQQN